MRPSGLRAKSAHDVGRNVVCDFWTRWVSDVWAVAVKGVDLAKQLLDN
jgi:hypothetical protein